MSLTVGLSSMVFRVILLFVGFANSMWLMLQPILSTSFCRMYVEAQGRMQD